MNFPDDESHVDADLAELVEEIVGKLQAGGSVDVAEYQSRYPGLTERIDELIPTLRCLGNAHDVSTQSTEAISQIGGHFPALGVDPDIQQLGDFQIERQIGRGGMGVVYLARQITLDRLVALKVLPFAAIANDRQLARFKVEAQAAAGLHHHGIVPVYFVGCDRGVHYYAMQFIDGKSLGSVLSDLRSQRHGSNPTSGGKRVAIGSFPEVDQLLQSISSSGNQRDVTSHSEKHFRAMAELGIQAAEALDYAHQSGVVHRDIKPGNLLLDREGKLWVTDFGLARIEQDSELTMTGDMVGTLRYMSPEQVLSPRTGTDHRCDIYSLGVTLYEMLTLQRAFNSEDRQETLLQIQFRDPVPPSKLNPKIPADLETIVLKAIEKDPEARYQSAQSLADDLRAFLEDRLISAKRPSFYARTLKWGRRHPAAVNSAILILILVALGSALSTVLLRNEQSETKQALAAAENNFQRSEKHRLSAEEAIARSETLLYVRGLGLAARARRDGDGAGAAALMKSNPAYSERRELRGFEWNVLDRSLSPSFKTIDQGRSEKLSTAWSVNGNYFATGDDAGRIQIWESETDQVIATINEQQSPNGQQSPNEQQGPVHCLAFHPNSQSLASVSADGSLRIWEIPSGRELGSVVDCHDGAEVFSVAFSHQGDRIVTAGADRMARVWHSESLDSLAACEGHSGDIRAVAFSPDDKTVATASNDRTVRLWDAITGRHLQTFVGHTGMVLHVTFSRSGNYLISGSNDHSIRFWDRDSGNCSAVLRGHHDGVQSIATLPDGKRIVAADRSGQIRYWHIVGKNQIDRFDDAVIDGLHAVRLSPDGRCWAGVTVEGRLLVRDLSTKRTHEVQSGIANQYPRAYPERIAFSPSGLQLYCADRILSRDSLDSFTWDPVLKLDVPAGVPGQFSPDGRILATGWNTTIRLWDPSDASLLGELETPAKMVIGLRFSPTGNQLAAWFQDDRKIVIWDIESQTVLKEIELDDSRLVDLEYSPDGTHFATCSWAGEVRIWDELGKDSKVLSDLGGNAETIAWLHGGRALAVGIPGKHETIHWLDDSKVVETIGENQRIWDIDVSQEHSLVLSHDYEYGAVVRDLETLDIRSNVTDVLQGHSDRVWSVCVSPSGESMVSAGRDGCILRWSRPIDHWNWLARRSHHDHLVDDLDWTSDGSRLVVSRKLSCSIDQWPLGTRVAEAEWRERSGSDPVGFAFEAIATDPKGQWIATGHRDGTVRIWDSMLQSPIETLSGLGMDAGVWSLKTSADGRFLAACSHKNNLVKLWRTDTWEEHWTASADDCDDLTFSPDGSQLVYCDGREVVLVDAATGNEMHRFRDHSITVHGVAFSRDGQLVATACEDRKLRLWDAQTGELQSTLSGHVESIRRVVFSRDNETIATGDANGSIRLWHVETRQEIYELANLGVKIDKLAFDPDGNILLAITSDGQVHLFDGRSP